MSYIYEVIEHLLRLQIGIWLCNHTINTTTFPQIFESWLKSYLMQLCKPCHYALIEAVEPFKLHPMSMAYLYEVFEHFSGWGWAYGFTLTSLPPQTLPQICESLLKSYLLQVFKPCHYALIEAVEPFKLYSLSKAYIYEVFQNFSGYGWAYGFTLTSLPPQTLPQICESRLKSYLMQVCTPCQYTLVDPVEPFKLHSLIYVIHS